MSKIPFEKSSGNVFADIGFTPAEAAELTAKSSLIITLKGTIEQRKLTQQEAARFCETDQPTLSKVLRGRMGERHYRPACQLAQRAWTGRRDHRQMVPARAPPRPPARDRSLA